MQCVYPRIHVHIYIYKIHAYIHIYIYSSLRPMAGSLRNDYVRDIEARFETSFKYLAGRGRRGVPRRRGTMNYPSATWPN